ncbi:MAG: hypothetical protein RSB72_01930, partial [Bacilli bacterium]
IKQTLTIITDHNYPMKVFTLTPKKIQVKKYKKNNSYETKTYNKNLKTNKIKNNYQGNKQRTFNSSNRGK